MFKRLLRTLAATALGSLAVASQAATVSLTQWAYGDSWSNAVTVGSPDHQGAAGGFKGAVLFGASDSASGFSGLLSGFITYCVEIQESFTLPSSVMTGYNVLAGANYSEWNNTNGLAKTAVGTSDRLGQLLSYAESNHAIRSASAAADSTSLQLAIWNVIYDNDNTVGAGAFSEKSGSSYDAYADTLLAGSTHWSKMFDVYVLQKNGTQDFLLTRDTGRVFTATTDAINNIPEPASLALAALGLVAAGAACRRHKA
jgi:MYXO-CTERM domain-containing protein